MNIITFKNEEEKKTSLSMYSDPFKQDKIEEIVYRISCNWWTSYVTKYRATITFKNGKTNGTHEIESNDFPTLLTEVDTFIKSL